MSLQWKLREKHNGNELKEHRCEAIKGNTSGQGGDSDEYESKTFHLPSQQISNQIKQRKSTQQTEELRTVATQYNKRLSTRASRLVKLIPLGNKCGNFFVTTLWKQQRSIVITGATISTLMPPK